ncbi:hypothetical protein ANME2D_01221 [Candidatus Methanoperedens nitroreducens]|uniref:Uncharacterized protein n=1 Tax=Candidatus Methanoperedens nitratireducens TaxID=1392998 RepID=A0A062V0W4_9EURY|nr:hypothetical protein [Candidatus Methanoperedens nitroreducens]KCZ72786.1 hypothetical protein ANME2D_01221 [Candidatus Methanoperedens nitroreducens]MCZ7622480.1 hypothetical protein [Candidatus Kuenenia sp.]MDJ1423285.1 hypothetical protein [Candidatus Methanoperedens sp.]
MNVVKHRVHRVHRAKLQLSVLSASSVCQKIDAFLPHAMAKLPSGYELTRALPENLRSSLPGVEELEAEPGGIHKEESGDE